MRGQAFPFYKDCISSVMNLIQRYKHLIFWNKLAVWGAIASIIALIVGLPIAILSFHYGPSEEKIQAAVRKALQDNESNLRMKYGEKYSVAVITPDGFVVPKGEVPSGINVKWETGRVVHMSSERVQIVVPEIIAHTVHAPNVYISGNTVNLPKKIGAKVNLIKTIDFSVAIEVIGIDRDLVVVGLGMATN
jgi:hypothetical protein